MRSTWIAFAALLAVACSGQEKQSGSLLATAEDDVANENVQDHTSVPEPHLNVCGVKYEGSSFEGAAPSWDAVWVKAGQDICCIEGACPTETSAPPSCACYALAENTDGEATTTSVGFAPGIVDGPQDSSEGALFCHEISFVMFQSACQPPPDDGTEPPDDTVPPPDDGTEPPDDTVPPPDDTVPPPNPELT